MDFIYVFGIFVVTSYLIQVIFNLRQTKYFNKIYCEMKRNGKVLIGKNKGHLVAGTIVLLQLNQNNVIKNAKKLQGITVFAKFKTLKSVIGLNVMELDQNNLFNNIENKLTIKALKNAKKNYIEYQQNLNV